MYGSQSHQNSNPMSYGQIGSALSGYTIYDMPARANGGNQPRVMGGGPMPQYSAPIYPQYGTPQYSPPEYQLNDLRALSPHQQSQMGMPRVNRPELEPHKRARESAAKIQNAPKTGKESFSSLLETLDNGGGGSAAPSYYGGKTLWDLSNELYLFMFVVAAIAALAYMWNRMSGLKQQLNTLNAMIKLNGAFPGTVGMAEIQKIAEASSGI
jgi:hypothetical protein